MQNILILLQIMGKRIIIKIPWFNIWIKIVRRRKEHKLKKSSMFSQFYKFLVNDNKYRMIRTDKFISSCTGFNIVTKGR